MITYEEINNKIQDLAKAVGEHNTYIKNNERRANRAACIVEQYEPSEPLETNLIDLLTDLRHLVGQNEIDFESAVFMSELHYEAELL